MSWKPMLAYITGSVNEDLLRRIEYLLEENCEPFSLLLDEGSSLLEPVERIWHGLARVGTMRSDAPCG